MDLFNNKSYVAIGQEELIQQQICIIIKVT